MNFRFRIIVVILIIIFLSGCFLKKRAKTYREVHHSFNVEISSDNYGA